MFHTIAFSGSIASSTTALTNAAGVADPVLRVSGNYIYMPALSQIMGYYAIGQYATQAQLRAPSLRRFANIDVAPIDQAAAPASPYVFSQRLLSPIKLDPDEGLEALFTNTGGTGGVASLLVHLSDGPVAPVSGEMITVRFTATIPSGNYTWNNAAITLGQTLPVGTYQCVGARTEGSNVIATRFVPVGQVFRPGIIACTSAAIPDIDDQRYGRSGVLFEFNQLTPPTVDIFHVGASGTLTGYMDLIKKS